MSDKKMFSVRIESVGIEGRLRETDAAEVEKLAASMKEIGQITPIEVRHDPDDAEKYILVSGAHRVAAAGSNGDDEILAVLFDGTPDHARLREIDENLYRHELTPYDQANFLAERKQIWERIHGEVRAGRPARKPDGRKSGQLGRISEPVDFKRFYSEVGELFAMPERTVRRALERKRCIIAPIWERLRGTAEAKNGKLLDRLADVEPGEQQKLFAWAESSGNNFAVALSYHRPEAGEKKPPGVSQLVAKIKNAWPAWDENERSVFLREMRKLK